MSGFSFSEILCSVFCAILYGAIFSILYCTIECLIYFLNLCKYIPKHGIFYSKILSLSIDTDVKETNKKNTFFIFLRIIMFAIGFMLLSYITLDGKIRLYMLILSSASYLISNFVFFTFFKRIVTWIFEKIFMFLVVIFRLFAFPIKIFVQFITKKCK